jgi:hypothetical protein
MIALRHNMSENAISSIVFGAKIVIKRLELGSFVKDKGYFNGRLSMNFLATKRKKESTLRTGTIYKH